MEKNEPPRFQRDRNSIAFFRGFLRKPEVVASVIPSSRYLEKRIVEACAVQDAKLVVELGPGTGGTTQALLQALPADAKLLAIDVESEFVQMLNAFGDDRLVAHCGRAEDIASILTEHGLPAPDVVVSGIPFSTISHAQGEEIIRRVWQSLKPGGKFVAYQFRDRVAMLGRKLLGAPTSRLELRNVPPMRVYQWFKDAVVSAHGAAA